jgi:hypothetical protein
LQSVVSSDEALPNRNPTATTNLAMRSRTIAAHGSWITPTHVKPALKRAASE